LRIGRVRELVPDAAGERDTQSDPHERERERQEAREPFDAQPPLRRDRVAREQTRCEVDEHRTGNEDEREDPAVVDPHRPHLVIFRDAWQRERNPECSRTHTPAQRERCETLDTATAVDERPGDCEGAGKHDAEARVREQQRDDERVEQDNALEPASHDSKPERDRHTCVAKECQLVPVVERCAKAREPSVVGVQRRDALCEERPGRHEPDERRGSKGDLIARQACADEDPEERKRKVDEGSVREDPRAIGRDRPDDRDARPHRKPEQAPEEERCRTVESRRFDDEESREEERAAADPHERGDRGATGEKQGAERDRSGAERSPGPADAFARSAHGR
jgi:hypothetical protein